MEFRNPKQWVSSMNVPTALMFTLSVITVVFSIIIARSSSTDTIPEMYEGGRGIA